MNRIFTYLIFSAAVLCLMATVAVGVAARAYNNLELERTRAGLERLRLVQQVLARNRQSNSPATSPSVHVRRAPAPVAPVDGRNGLPAWAQWYAPRQLMLHRGAIATFVIGFALAIIGFVRRVRVAYGVVPEPEDGPANELPAADV